jgi:[acyl-carrier-protein] S-malonyltransferase
VFAILAPGQGAQTPGFLDPWLKQPGVSERLSWWSAVADVDVLAMGTTADAETIRDTAVAQPLLVAAGMAAATQLLDGTRAGVSVAAGHSVGELTAAVVASALSAEAALTLVKERSRGMAAASAAEPTGMSAVMGGEPEDVLARLDELSLTAANQNGAGQVVAAGRLDALEQLAAEPPAKARVRPLSVAGAFHTHYMQSARERLAAVAAGAPVRDPAIRLLSNADGAVVGSGPELLRRLVDQVAAPVRWDLCMRALAALGVTAVVELPPAGTLTSLVRRALPGVEALALKTPDDLPAARALLAEHREPGHSAEAAPAWRLVVAPFAGTFQRQAVNPGDTLDAGETLGIVVTRRNESPVQTPYGGVLIEWLAEDGDPVGPGQPLARLHPEAVPA